jgi:hypothetical protein
MGSHGQAAADIVLARESVYRPHEPLPELTARHSVAVRGSDRGLSQLSSGRTRTPAAFEVWRRRFRLRGKELRMVAGLPF